MKNFISYLIIVVLIIFYGCSTPSIATYSYPDNDCEDLKYALHQMWDSFPEHRVEYMEIQRYISALMEIDSNMIFYKTDVGIGELTIPEVESNFFHNDSASIYSKFYWTFKTSDDYMWCSIGVRNDNYKKQNNCKLEIRSIMLNENKYMPHNLRKKEKAKILQLFEHDILKKLNRILEKK